MNQDEKVQMIMKAIGAGVVGDHDEAIDTFMEIGQRCTGDEMYGVCCALAGASIKFINKVAGPEAAQGPWTLQERVPGALAQDPAQQFAARFLVAYANNDSDNTLALFHVAIHATPEEYVESVCALFAQTVGHGRMADAATPRSTE